MKTLVGGVLAASLLSLAAPATAQTLPSDPIALQRVDVIPNTSPSSGFPTIVHVAFANTNQLAARKVTFLITDGGGRQVEVDDVGTFTQGTSVRHDFRFASLDSSARVRVVSVTLADGSAWSNGSAEALPRRQAAATEDAAVESPEFDVAR
jgi:hypothetical protein